MTLSDILLFLSLIALVFIGMQNFSKNNVIQKENKINDNNEEEDDELTEFDKNVWQPIIERPWDHTMIDIGTPNYRDAWKNY